MEKEKIIFREWFICLSVLFSIVFLFSVSGPTERGLVQEVEQDGELKEKVKVFVSGAVLRPGEYEVDVGSSLKSVLVRAGFTSFADKKALYSKKTVLNSCEVFVPEKSVKKDERSSRF